MEVGNAGGVFPKNGSSSVSRYILCPFLADDSPVWAEFLVWNWLNAWILKISILRVLGFWIAAPGLVRDWSIMGSWSSTTVSLLPLVLIILLSGSFRIGESYNRTRLGQTVKLVSLPLTINFPFVASSHHSVNNGVCDQWIRVKITSPLPSLWRVVGLQWVMRDASLKNESTA